MSTPTPTTPMSTPTIIIDTREQEPYSFDSLPAVRQALPAGDYSLLGLETSIAVERKTLDDFIGTVIRSRARFRKELRRLAGYRAACVVVEANLDDIASRQYRSGAHPRAVLGAALAIIVDFGVPVFFCGTRQAARTFTELFLLRHFENEQRHAKNRICEKASRAA